MIYEPYNGSLVTNTGTGHTAKAWIALTDWIATEGTVMNSPANMGDTLRLSAGPVFKTGYGALPIECFRDSVEVPGETSGNMGSLTLLFKPKIFIKGDSPAALELLKDILNKPHILWVQKAGAGCSGQVIQYGSLCDPAEIESAAPATGTLRSGQSGYEVNYESTTKYFFNTGASLTEYVDPDTQLGVPTGISISGATATEADLNYTLPTNADGIDIEIDTTSDFASPILDVPGYDGVIPYPIISLTASTLYYVRIRAVGAGYTASDWVLVAFMTTA